MTPSCVIRMSPSATRLFMAAAVLAVVAVPAGAQDPAPRPQATPATAPAPLPQPQVGDLAPDFEVPGATKSGASGPLKLSALRGRTVVLAFFPRARTSGCTVQMKAYRDRHAEITGGKDVAIIGISTDADTTLAAWARELDTPVHFASDSAGAVGRAYGALREGARGRVDARHLYVIGPDGRVAHKMVPFNELSADSYTELATAIQRAGGR